MQDALTMSGITTHQYRMASKEFFLATKDERSTSEQIENGFKCLSLMYFALNEEAEFSQPEMQEIKRNENVRILNMASGYRLEWLTSNLSGA